MTPLRVDAPSTEREHLSTVTPIRDNVPDTRHVDPRERRSQLAERREHVSRLVLD